MYRSEAECTMEEERCNAGGLYASPLGSSLAAKANNDDRRFAFHQSTLKPTFRASLFRSPVSALVNIRIFYLPAPTTTLLLFPSFLHLPASSESGISNKHGI
jgi:hypothetical protein